MLYDSVYNKRTSPVINIIMCLDTISISSIMDSLNFPYID